MYIGTNAFNIEKWNAIVYTNKLFPNAKNQALSLGNNFSMYILHSIFCVEGILFSTWIKILLLFSGIRGVENCLL